MNFELNPNQTLCLVRVRFEARSSFVQVRFGFRFLNISYSSSACVRSSIEPEPDRNEPRNTRGACHLFRVQKLVGLFILRPFNESLLNMNIIAASKKGSGDLKIVNETPTSREIVIRLNNIIKFEN